MPTIPLTKRGAEKLKAELHKLKTVDRHSVIKSISEARAQGDLSENAEYEAAKDRQGFIEGRIQEIESKLAAAQIIDPAQEDEADLKHGLINISSPIARALIGKEQGDTAEVQAPGGVKHYEIVAVNYL
jgi:transcription elongation factor GreA